MAYFQAKTYQDNILTSIEQYFKTCHELQNPNTAFYKMTGVSYQPLKGFAEDMPYFCLRVPTGGGKTWLAASSVKLVNTHLLRTTHSVILWLVPSNQIKEQTLTGLKERKHLLNEALLTAGAITVLSLDEAKSVQPSTVNTSTTIIVATRQAFQVENEESRKVYENNGALMGHFARLNPAQIQELQKDGVITYSLANVLSLHRPFIIVDEAHNSRTPLSFDTLAKFNPSGIMELTATPDMEKTPSNVLHSVSAVELKLEQMIKLPILLRTEPNWQQCLAYALTCRNDLQVLADKEYRQGANYLRPLILIQAEAKRAGIETRDVQAVKHELITNHAIPEQEIVIATGEERGLTALAQEYPLGIMDKKCPVKFVITQKALAEGWDCSFAYILVSMANLHSSTAVEQLLGRILRQPNATHRHTPELNQSHAFVVSLDFSETATALRDSLVKGAGFERKEVGQFVKPSTLTQLDLDTFKGRKIPPIPVKLTEKPVLTQLPKALKEKVSWNNDTQELTITSPLTVEDAEALKTTFATNESRIIIDKVAEESRLYAIEFFKTPAERGERLRVPQLAVYIQGGLQLFDDPQMLDYPWDLSRYEANPSENVISKFKDALKHEAGLIDMDNMKGTVKISFIAELQRNLELVYEPEHFDTLTLTTWLCRNLPDNSATHAQKQAFILAWLQALLESFNLVEVNEQKFLVRDLLEQQLKELRNQAIKVAYQETLFEKNRATVSDNYIFEFPPFYSPTRYYETNSKYGHYHFEHHFYGEIADFDSKEEFECACHLDQLAAKKQIKFWVRNLVRKESCSFFLQKSDGRFYPDFICVLPDDSILIVEYKGANAWKDAEDDRLIGGLWASLSNGKCKFMMVKDKNWAGIDNQLG